MRSKARTRELTAAEMLELWRLVRRFEPLRDDAELQRSDGTDLDRALREDLRRWYADQYARLEDWQLPQADVSGEVDMLRTAERVGILVLPDRCVRPTEVLVEGWERPAIITPEGSELAAEQCSRWTRGATVNPVAVVSASGEMRLYTLPPHACDIERLTAVVRPDEGTYLVTDYMLPEIFED